MTKKLKDISKNFIYINVFLLLFNFIMEKKNFNFEIKLGK